MNNNIKLTKEFIDNFFNKHSDTMELISISEPNKNRKRKLKWKCITCGSVQESILDGKFFKRKYYCCKKCCWNQINKEKSDEMVLVVKKFLKNNTELELISKEYKNIKSKLLFKCSCGEVFETSFEIIKNGKIKCNKCAYIDGGVKNTTEKYDIIYKLEKELGDGYTVLNKDNIVNMDSNIEVKHNKCGNTFNRKVKKIINSKQSKCPFCNNSTSLTNESAKFKLEKITDEFEFIELIDGKLKIKKEECGCILTRSLSSLRRSNGASCECQTQSIGSKRVQKFLTESNICFTKEDIFEGCVYVKPLKFDFYLPNYNCCIEYDGRQHDESIPRWGGDDGLKIRKIRDGIKNKYCYDNNILLIRIKRQDLKNDIYKKIILDKLIPR